MCTCGSGNNHVCWRACRVSSRSCYGLKVADVSLLLQPVGRKQPAGKGERRRERERERAREVDYLAASLTTVNWRGARQSADASGGLAIATSAFPLPHASLPHRPSLIVSLCVPIPSHLLPWNARRDTERSGQLWFHHGHWVSI